MRIGPASLGGSPGGLLYSGPPTHVNQKVVQRLPQERMSSPEPATDRTRSAYQVL
jgi:hypothetical protein